MVQGDAMSELVRQGSGVGVVPVDDDLVPVELDSHPLSVAVVDVLHEHHITRLDYVFELVEDGRAWIGPVRAACECSDRQYVEPNACTPVISAILLQQDVCRAVEAWLNLRPSEGGELVGYFSHDLRSHEGIIRPGAA